MNYLSQSATVSVLLQMENWRLLACDHDSKLTEGKGSLSCSIKGILTNFYILVWRWHFSPTQDRYEVPQISLETTRLFSLIPLKIRCVQCLSTCLFTSHWCNLLLDWLPKAALNQEQHSKIWMILSFKVIVLLLRFFCLFVLSFFFNFCS